MFTWPAGIIPPLLAVQEYVYVPFPPLTNTLIAPVASPLHNTLSGVAAIDMLEPPWVITIVLPVVQPYASVTVTV